ncbi:hypothetical protein [uncultured Methanobrevibacter sp.]|uniref:hypothetical protein n=1 Tax=uncultured Methanobrevibacter sp. TaxID=253161 RepID=UPI00320898CB
MSKKIGINKTKKINKHVSYDNFLKNASLIVLNDAETVKKKYASDSSKHYGKESLGKWDYKPDDYTGFKDTKYGTAFQCHYIESLKLFFVVIDIDVHNPEEDIPLNEIEAAIPKKYKNTYIVTTPSGGKHYYYLSEKPPELNSSNINIDYKTIFKKDVEKQTNGEYINKKAGGYVVSSFRWGKDGTEREEYIHDSSSNNEILIVNNADKILKTIFHELNRRGIIDDEKYNDFQGNSNEKVSAIKSFDIHVKLDNLDKLEKIKGNTLDGTVYEVDGLKYRYDGILLLNNANGFQIITRKIGEIISLTQNNHNDVLLALEGGLDHYNFSIEDRRTILYTGLEMADDFTNEHKGQIDASLKKNKQDIRKKGFPYLEKRYPHIKEQLNVIYNARHLFWNIHTNEEYQIMEIEYTALVELLATYMDDEGEEIAKLLNSYLKMKGVSVRERYELMEITYDEFGINGISDFLEAELTSDNKINNEHSLITSKGFHLNYTLDAKIRKRDDKLEGIELKKVLNKLAYKLDLQLSLITYGNYYPKIQPLINLIERPVGLEAYKRRQMANSFLRQHNCLKKTKDGNYIFDDVETNSYIQVDANKLGNFLSRKYPILQLGIESSELETILTISSEFDELHNEYYLFNNGVLNLPERFFTQTTNFADYFTTKKMDCNFSIDNITIDPLNTEPTCLVDRVLREIFIPRYKKGAEDQFVGYYMDFLQRVGAAFNTRIKEKKFPCYYGFGDNGKDIIIEILKMAFGDRSLLVTMDILQDDKADLSEYDVVIIDELDKKTFKDAIAFIKRITGGEEEGTAKRKHYSHEVFRPKNPSAFFLFTNNIPDVPLSETAFYRREDALELKNRFLDNPNSNKRNEFQADSSLKDKIKNAKEDSLEWLINAGLKAYYDCFNDNGFFKGFTMAQTADETKMIVSNTDPLTKFLRENYVADENQEETITNSELRDNYENYCHRNNISCDTSGLAINMGNAIKKVFGDVKKKAANDTRYFLRAKDETDLLTTYHVNTTVQWWQGIDLIPEATIEAHNQIYNRFAELNKSSTYPTKKQLIKEFPLYDVEEILENLIKANLIFKGKKQEVDENMGT